MSDIVIRHVEAADLPALLAIYNHYIETTAVTFDLEPKTLAQRQAWLDTFKPSGRYQCFVAVKDGVAIGWASSGRLREKAAYDTSIETSVYLKPGEQRRGLGRRLYQALFAGLAGQGVHRAYGCVTLPNQPSVGLHQALGFTQVGAFHEAGQKFGRFWDVAWFEKAF